ncbi:hypothetical protein ACFSTA_14170 [Ornithinibacillus salinisoli]|uniref:DUF4878 domain-containing protein n=1 Tax=Ornithinibacillus salinisoli TaxID=1848459 RepID=A0ABW4W1T0_9BACI
MNTKGKSNQIVILFIMVIVVALAIFLFFTLFKSSERNAIDTVRTFYEYEKNGSFAESWEMFHPFMKEKFDKGHYLQDRAHVFMNHFEVTTFAYSLEDAEKVTNWEMEENSEVIYEAYKVPVLQEYKGKYGNFTIIQDVYATEVEGEWVILWDYRK